MGEPPGLAEYERMFLTILCGLCADVCYSTINRRKTATCGRGAVLRFREVGMLSSLLTCLTSTSPRRIEKLDKQV